MMKTFTGNDPTLIVKYRKINAKIERMIEMVDIFMVKLNIIGFMGAALLQTLENYYIYDLGYDSFYLVTPAMWAKKSKRNNTMKTKMNILKGVYLYFFQVAIQLEITVWLCHRCSYWNFCMLKYTNLFYVDCMLVCFIMLANDSIHQRNYSWFEFI